MRQIRAILLALSVFGLPLQAAQGSEWGCEVLLCAASDNPSWHEVESCHPPMERLITAMKRPGFSWPTCPEGGAGKPGYDRYADCPAGWQPVAGDQDYDHGRSGELSRCSRTVRVCNGRTPQSADSDRQENTREGITREFLGRNSCEYREYVARPLRAQPYYFDIKSEQGGTERHYFDLRH
ncbi:hypothetical protein [Rhizobium fabae]|uniref:Uncharacterized protein n=1 Tax=Rhizobium fabae TaxID=573179 RepID=A0ABY0B4A1_9HYPH|nr:hypothetical protein [Rhizobium fabae]RUM10318.1 hypothetical protein EFB14_24055 [Rhizobium fabae]